MKQFSAYFLLAISLSSCLKQTIPGAMLKAEGQSSGGSAISMSYEVNGVLVKTTVNEANNNQGTYHQLSCEKTTYTINNANYYRYVLSLVSTSGELTFLFYTDSLQTKNYVYCGSYGTEHFLSYNNTNGYTRYASDSLSFNVTVYGNGRISGNFSGRLTPSIPGGAPDTFGTPGSIAIANGSFENVPVLY
jgi:hypothetical protein